jgi:hypothetical protein
MLLSGGLSPAVGLSYEPMYVSGGDLWSDEGRWTEGERTGHEQVNTKNSDRAWHFHFSSFHTLFYNSTSSQYTTEFIVKYVLL